MKPALAICVPLLLAAMPAQAAGTNVDIALENAHDSELTEGLGLLQAGKPAEAITVMDKVIAAYQQQHPTGINLCAANMADAVKVSVLAMAVGDKQPAPADGKPEHITVLGPGWCLALWARGYALVDLNQSPLAEQALAKAVEMAPGNAHYVNEYAEIFKSRREWQRSFDLFKMAWERVDHDRKSPDARIAARALRGMGYNQIELGDYKQAEKLFRQSLEYEPGSEAARRELDYIARRKATGT